jgi:hypothetical protein
VLGRDCAVVCAEWLASSLGYGTGWVAVAGCGSGSGGWVAVAVAVAGWQGGGGF